MAKRQNDNVTFVGNLMIIMFILAVLVMVISVKLGYTREGEYTITQVEKVSNTHGSSDHFTTEPKYYVYTDYGVFLIEMSGLNAYPFGLQLIGSKGFPKTLYMKTRGARLEWLGLYPNIIEIQENYE